MGINSGITPRSAKRLTTGEIVPAIVREAADVLYVSPNTGMNIGGLVEGLGGDFKTITEAIQYAIAAGCSASRPFTIRCAPALYVETFNFIDPTEVADMGIIVKGDPLCVIQSDKQHLFQGYWPGLLCFIDVVFRGEIYGPDYQLKVDRVGMTQKGLPHILKHVRFENKAADGGGNFAYLSPCYIAFHEVHAPDRCYLASCGRVEASDCQLLRIFQSYDAVLSPLPLSGPNGSGYRESTLSYLGANSLKGDGIHGFGNCSIKQLGMGQNSVGVSPIAEAYFCGFHGTLDVADASNLTEYACIFDCQPTVGPGATIQWSTGGGEGRGSYMPPVRMPAAQVPLVGDFPGQVIYVNDTRAGWADQRGVAGPATAGLIYWCPDGIAAWITF
jgi:hypothetical protein